MPEKPRNIMGVSGMTFALLGFFDFATSINIIIGRWVSMCAFFSSKVQQR